MNPLGSVTTLLGRMEQTPVLEMMTKEVVGINAPKIGITRSKDERFDVAVSELGNTAGTFGGGLVANRLINGVLKDGLSQTGTAAAKVAAGGSSMAFFSLLFSFMWAMPFVRNYMTAKRTGSTQFTQVIGSPQAQQQQQAQTEAAMTSYRNKALGILGLGAAGAGLSVLAAKAGLRGRAGMQNLARLPKWLVMEGGLFKNINKPQSLLFWGIPAYGGWIHASRDNFERKEQLLKFGAFVAAFFGPQAILDKVYDKKFEAMGIESPKLANIVKTLGNVGKDAGWKEVAQAAKAAPKGSQLAKSVAQWRNKNMFGLGASLLLLGVLPQVTNIFLTRRRIAKAGNGAAAPGLQQQPQQAPAVPRGNLQYKSLQSWGQQGASASHLASAPVQGRMA